MVTGKLILSVIEIINSRQFIRVYIYYIGDGTVKILMAITMTMIQRVLIKMVAESIGIVRQ